MKCDYCGNSNLAELGSYKVMRNKRLTLCYACEGELSAILKAWLAKEYLDDFVPRQGVIEINKA